MIDIAPNQITHKLAYGTGSSVIVQECQICGKGELQPVIFLGFLPPVNEMQRVGNPPKEQASYPAQMIYCRHCHLVQLGLTVDPAVLFPPEYPYSSGTTKILRENFAELYKDCSSVISLKPEDLIVDIGSNDGTLLKNFRDGGHRVLGIEPTDMGHVARKNGVPTNIEFFGPTAALNAKKENGLAKVITATNVFAHIENVHEIVESICDLLDEDGVFISESHYLLNLIETLQYDTIYHEHLRYYSVIALQNLFQTHDLEIVHCKRIPTHGGSIRVYAARKGRITVRESVGKTMEEEEKAGLNSLEGLSSFRERVALSKLQLLSLLHEIKKDKAKIYAVGAPSRASTLVNYVGLDDNILDCVLEINGSYKIGKYMPGTLIPVVDESRLFDDQPGYALLLSWHIADELIPKLKDKGFKGKFIVPLPAPHIVE